MTIGCIALRDAAGACPPSLGFGLPFATPILPVLVPCLYLMLEGLRERWGHLTNAHPTQEPTR